MPSLVAGMPGLAGAVWIWLTQRAAYLLACCISCYLDASACVGTRKNDHGRSPISSFLFVIGFF